MITKRRKLFSSSPKSVRRKLFSSPTVIVKCQDCGFEMETSDETTTQYCPKCGGKRFNVPEKIESKSFSDPSKPKQRRTLFSTAEDNIRYFSTTDNTELEKNLRMYSGKEITKAQEQKIFSDFSIIDEGLGEMTESGNIKLFSMADDMYRMFSSLKITVIKELSLDPPSGPCIDVIEGLKNEHPEIPTKTIVLMKKAHGLPKESVFSETENWIRESGIKEDLKDEFDGRDFTEDELKVILQDRYDDAPEETIECLKESGVISETPDGILHIKK